MRIIDAVAQRAAELSVEVAGFVYDQNLQKGVLLAYRAGQYAEWIIWSVYIHVVTGHAMFEGGDYIQGGATIQGELQAKERFQQEVAALQTRATEHLRNLSGPPMPSTKRERYARTVGRRD